MTTELLQVPTKKGSDVDMTGPLGNWIKSAFGSAENPADVSDVGELQKLRVAAVKSGDRGEAVITACSNYYDQLCSIEKKVPVNEVNIAFKWKDAFDKGSIFGGRISLTIPSFAYDKICVLFNIAAHSANVAAEQNVESEDGMQKAMKKLQSAAGIFAYLRDNALVAIQRDSLTMDLDGETLGILSELMLAQAQEMVILKAIKGGMKDNVVAKLCSQCDDYFASIMKKMQYEDYRTLWPSNWLPTICGKQALYNGLAQYHESKVCNAEKNIGEEIARLENALRLLKASMERSVHPDQCNASTWYNKAEKALAEAKKDNDFIYHERIPEYKNLKLIGKAAVAKATPLPEKLGNSSKVLFDELCPLAVHQALAAFDTRKKEMVKRELERLTEATNLANVSMSSMNLPAALEVTKGNEIPQSLRDKSQAVITAGGPDSIKKMIQELPELLTRNTEILEECERLLREEKESDSQLREQFKEKWTRTASDKLTSSFEGNAQKYRTIINNAKDADKVVKEKFENHREFIVLLAQGANNMEANLPAGSNQVKSGPTATKLKSLCEDIETLKAERQVMESEVKSSNPDMKNTFLNVHSKEGVINEAELSQQTLQNALGPLIQQISDSLKRQETILKEMTEENEKFVKENGGGQNSGNQRDEILKKLAAAHDAFFELQKHLQEGTKFYNDLTQLLVTFQSKVSDYCFARKTEKDELMKDLTASLSTLGVTGQAEVTPPAHHTQASVLDMTTTPTRPPRVKDPPARPPPPTSAPSAPAPADPAPNPYAGAPAAPAAANPYAGAPPGANPYAGAPPAPAANPYAGAPAPPGANPYPGAPPGVNPYPGAPGAVPYPAQPNMPMPYQGYPPAQQGAYPYPQQGYYPPPPQGYPQPYGYPPQGPPAPGQQPYYPAPQNPQNPPQWR